MATRAKRFAFFDIDGTLMRWQMLHAVFDKLGKAGHLLEGDYETFLTARLEWKKRIHDEGFREYELKLIQVVERNLAAIDPTDFQAAADAVFAKHKDQTYRFTRDLIHDLKAKGYVMLAISGIPGEMAEHFMGHYGFDDLAATRHYVKNGRYTGEIMAAPHHKPELLQQMIDKHGLTLKGSVGIGDSEGDIGMLDMVEHPIAFNPSKGLFRHAQAQGWKVVLERKAMIYELEPVDGQYRLIRTNI